MSARNTHPNTAKPILHSTGSSSQIMIINRAWAISRFSKLANKLHHDEVWSCDATLFHFIVTTHLYCMISLISILWNASTLPGRSTWRFKHLRLDLSWDITCSSSRAVLVKVFLSYERNIIIHSPQSAFWPRMLRLRRTGCHKYSPDSIVKHFQDSPYFLLLSPSRLCLSAPVLHAFDVPELRVWATWPPLTKQITLPICHYSYCQTVHPHNENFILFFLAIVLPGRWPDLISQVKNNGGRHNLMDKLDIANLSLKCSEDVVSSSCWWPLSNFNTLIRVLLTLFIAILAIYSFNGCEAQPFVKRRNRRSPVSDLVCKCRSRKIRDPF